MQKKSKTIIPTTTKKKKPDLLKNMTFFFKDIKEMKTQTRVKEINSNEK